MRKLVLLSVLAVGFITNLKAQESKVVTADARLQEFIKDPTDSAALLAAKEAIDIAANNDKTKDEPKTNFYRANIYITYFEWKLSAVLKKLLPAGTTKAPDNLNKLKTQAYASIDTTPICVAANSYLRVIQLEPTKTYADDSRGALPRCAAHVENQATSYFDNKKYEIALAMFQKAIAIGKVVGYKDTADFMVQNVQNCAIAADRLHNTVMAVMYYQKLIDLKVGGSAPYTALVTMYNSQKDTAKAMDVLRKGRAAFPQDVNLLISETNYYLQSGKTDKAIGNLQSAIDKLTMENKPENNKLISNLYFVLGNTFDRMANPKDDAGKALAKPANFDDLFGKAEDNYKKAIALTPDNFDEEYDLGALYNNRASQLNKEANDVPPTDNTGKYDKLTGMAKDYLTKAQGPLEKAHALNPADKDTVRALMQVYASTGQTDKVKDLQSGK